MNRVLLAVVLVLACAAPASAWSKKTHGKAEQAESDRPPKYPWKSRKARRKFDRREVQEENKDPYWEPCDYTTNWGPNGCGGR
jgi:hypothetical protein